MSQPHEHKKWMSIGRLQDVVAYLRKGKERGWDVPDSVTYMFKAKLHGTNAGVQIHPDGTVIAQSRGRIITPGDDNAGFAAWVDENRDAWANRGWWSLNCPITVYGEWIGPGIQRGVACAEIPERALAVFAIVRHEADGDVVVWGLDEIGRLLCPVLLTLGGVRIIGAHELADGSHLRLTLDPANPEPFAEAVSGAVDAVGRCDPWVRYNYGIEGPGEGLVAYPVGVPAAAFSSLIFKAKDSKHEVNAQRRPAMAKADAPAGVEEFAARMVTENRCRQAIVEACAGEVSMRSMAAFLKWVGQDVKREGAAELDAAGLTWKEVSRAVTNRARAWLVRECGI